ncbi:hypothetical protein CEK26_003305 [Fusarium fujikuroi]|nr:hypothetical protein CEK27_003300 [Fusarium fujikuroi]QGI88305.1 hypothetical protein CEK25_003261 [Fusarium fujikuroi]QGJ01861.1 hypothetical protein CEK26_003305 [Fusarium fujikuroi]SCN70218.1 uncharacterized protein FFE2_01924 [Fusarium fujikuroi]SCV54960.1 uncharacterized protein FFFS_11519 [Fusarium fujikuroi]
MDFLSRLPAPIRTQILIDLGSPACIERLIRASPTMLQQYTVDRDIVVREVLKEITSLDKTGGLIQDAMALLYLADLEPKQDAGERRKRGSYYHSRGQLYTSGYGPWDKHRAEFLHHYENQNFPNALENSEKPTQLKIYRLISQMILRIEDYRWNEDYSEPTRPSYPFRHPSLQHGRSWSSREYEMRVKLGVPPRAEWLSNDPWPLHQLHQLQHRQRQLDRIQIPFPSLESWEKCLFLRAFLKYELFSTLDLLFGSRLYLEYFAINPFCRFLSSQERDAIVLVHWHHKIHWCKIPTSDSTDDRRSCACFHKLRSLVQIL